MYTSSANVHKGAFLCIYRPASSAVEYNRAALIDIYSVYDFILLIVFGKPIAQGFIFVVICGFCYFYDYEMTDRGYLVIPIVGVSFSAYIQYSAGRKYRFLYGHICLLIQLAVSA